MLIVSNQSLAEFNLTKEPELISAKERLCEMYADAEKLYKSVIEKVNTISKYQCFSFNICVYFYSNPCECLFYVSNSSFSSRSNHFFFQRLNNN